MWGEETQMMSKCEWAVC